MRKYFLKGIFMALQWGTLKPRSKHDRYGVYTDKFFL
jgi:hypothetical protein